ncbi:nucleotide exchange factor GrpE [Corynebacterium minutissimum]|uniref:Protein GrpE n=1 Tax=Corynebacterium minutissimum TaxID=38301 RepID=A0A2X4R5J9_9CORY|nr:nucleotide exchange factor GrpE [Corynebacterium minutissimum]KHO30749.1 heat shock protein GrpE [Corynebacterium minutissimum]QPS59772.1 nucleotide exchange factor GrpE [Corynebacterium minutissimum]QQA79438.1 nucleotide exchange factor GrpE [Corynebacterium minutissimum]SQH98457.1 heat shock protein GrpE [Corynebacterium minutissimum]VEG06949.1 heat shock protein GrpE [Corynebacterium minutissimum]
MTSPQDPGNPANTDPEATSADAAEAAAAEAAAADSAVDEAAEAQANAATAGTAEAEAAVDDAASDIAEEAAAGDDAAVEDSLEAQLAERTEDLQRLNAEYTNYRRRTERDRQAVIETSKAKVLADFLPILDDLELARQHGDLNEGPLKAIADKLNGVLTANNLSPFGEEGDAFDPEVHEAVQDLSSGDEQVVGTVLRRGYKVGERVVRTAMVIIADPAGSAESPDNPDSAE